MPLAGHFSRRISGLVSTSAARRLRDAPGAPDARPMESRLRQAFASRQIEGRAIDVTPHDRLANLRELGARLLGHATEDL